MYVVFKVYKLQRRWFGKGAPKMRLTQIKAEYLLMSRIRFVYSPQSFVDRLEDLPLVSCVVFQETYAPGRLTPFSNHSHSHRHHCYASHRSRSRQNCPTAMLRCGES